MSVYVEESKAIKVCAEREKKKNETEAKLFNRKISILEKEIDEKIKRGDFRYYKDDFGTESCIILSNFKFFVGHHLDIDDVTSDPQIRKLNPINKKLTEIYSSNGWKKVWVLKYPPKFFNMNDVFVELFY